MECRPRMTDAGLVFEVRRSEGLPRGGKLQLAVKFPRRKVWEATYDCPQGGGRVKLIAPAPVTELARALPFFYAVRLFVVDPVLGEATVAVATCEEVRAK